MGCFTFVQTTFVKIEFSDMTFDCEDTLKLTLVGAYWYVSLLFRISHFKVQKDSRIGNLFQGLLQLENFGQVKKIAFKTITAILPLNFVYLQCFDFGFFPK